MFQISDFYKQSIVLGVGGGVRLPVRYFLLFVHINAEYTGQDEKDYFDLDWVLKMCNCIAYRDTIVKHIVYQNPAFKLDGNTNGIAYAIPGYFTTIAQLIEEDYKLFTVLPYIPSANLNMRRTAHAFITEANDQEIQQPNGDLANCLLSAFASVLDKDKTDIINTLETGNPDVRGFRDLPQTTWDLYLSVISGHGRNNVGNPSNPPIMNLLAVLTAKKGNVNIIHLGGILVAPSFDQITEGQARMSQDIFLLSVSEAVRWIRILEKDGRRDNTLQNALITTFTRLKEGQGPTTYFDVDLFKQVLSEYNNPPKNPPASGSTPRR